MQNERAFGEFNKVVSPHARPNEQVLWHSLNRRVGRVIDRAGLEIRYTPFGYRGFESLTLRNKKRNHIGSFFCSHLSPLTSYLSHLTSYILHLTSHLLPLTSYLSPLTSYILPLTSYLSPLTSYILPLNSSPP